MNKQKGFTVIELLTALVGLASIALVIAGIVIAVHFIAKFW